MTEKHTLSRRSLIAGLSAAIPATVAAAVPALPGTDPIFSAIEAHKAAWLAYGDAISAACDVEEVLFDRGLRGFGSPKGVVVGHRRKLECIQERGGMMNGGSTRFEATGEMEPILVHSHEEVDQHFDSYSCPPARPAWVAAERARCHAELDAQRESIEAGERDLGWPEAQLAASEASWGAWHSLLTTRPNTLAGLLALVKYAAHHDDGASEEGRKEILDAIEAHLTDFVGPQSR